MAGHAPHPLARSIPDAYAARLGRIVVRCSRIEHLLLLVTKRLLGINIAKARTTFRHTRWDQWLTRLLDAAGKHQSFRLTIPAGNWAKRFQSAEKRRNLLVHAAWRDDSKGGYLLYMTRGSFATAPTPVRIDTRYLAETRQILDECVRMLDNFDRQTRVLV